MTKVTKKNLLKLAREQAEYRGKVKVQHLCEMVFGTATGHQRRLVSSVLDEAGIPRVRTSRKSKPKPPRLEDVVLPPTWGQLTGITSGIVDRRLSVSEAATLDYPEVELYLAKQAKMGNRDAFTVLKDLIEA